MKNLTLATLLSSSKHTVFFGGAGVSTESGIPDFRSSQGLYHQSFPIPAEEVLSRTFFEAHPAEFYSFYRKHLLYPNAQPNGAHIALARLEKAGHLDAVITQNIDGLHQKAGSRTVYELHGSCLRNHCMNCAHFYDLTFFCQTDGIPRCPKCGGIVKPDVVLYEEPLDQTVLENACRAIAAADLLIVGGTSLRVYPAASLLQYFHGNAIAILNRDATRADEQATLVCRDSIAAVLTEAADQVLVSDS